MQQAENHGGDDDGEDEDGHPHAKVGKELGEGDRGEDRHPAYHGMVYPPSDTDVTVPSGYCATSAPHESAGQPPARRGGSAVDPTPRPGGAVVFPARRPAALVMPLALLTEAAGVGFVLHGLTIGWAVVSAPVGALVVTGLLFRPRLELSCDGVVQRQYPFSSLTRWEAIADVGLTRAGNRLILGYRLHPGVPRPRRQPAAALLRAAGRPYDGGWFVDSLAADPEEVAGTIAAFLSDPQRRAALPPTPR